MTDSIDVVSHVIDLLKYGRRTSTYKHAVLMGLMDVCLEHTDARGEPPTTVTTRQLAEKVLELYWRQVAPWGDQRLRQNASKTATILQQVEALRQVASGTTGVGAGPRRVRLVLPDVYEQAVRDIEWTLIRYPLPKLQRVGGQDTGWLYAIGWDDGDNLVRKAQVTAYQRGRASTFDNRIHLRPHAAMAFVRLHSLLRPFIEEQWTRDVAGLNRLEQHKLHDFLFGASRRNLAPVRRPLLDLQSGACFYCKGPVREGGEVDHFIPWSRHAHDGLHNLVVAHKGCNGAKSDFLAAVPHLERWRERNDQRGAALEQIGDHLAWETGGPGTLGAARAVYLTLPEDARLWARGKVFVTARHGVLEGALA